MHPTAQEHENSLNVWIHETRKFEHDDFCTFMLISSLSEHVSCLNILLASCYLLFLLKVHIFGELNIYLQNEELSSFFANFISELNIRLARKCLH